MAWAMAMALPFGTVTLLFSDIEGSTRLLEGLGTRYDGVLDQHRSIIRDAVGRHGGEEVRTEGDAFFVAFQRAGDAVRAAVAAQRGLAAFEWPAEAVVRVRMGLHTGEPRLVGGDYVGIDVHCAARICSSAHGGQVVVSEATERLVAGQPVDGVALQDLGDHRLKDLSRPLRLYQVAADGLIAAFPPLRTLEQPRAGDLGQWAPPTALIGRDDDLDELVRLARGLRCRLITLVGPGGVGKTRLAIAAAIRLAGDFADGARFVPLASVVESRDLASAIARALGTPIREGESSLSAVRRFLADRHLLLVLDNFEQLVEGAPLVGELVSACPAITVLVTSREPARLAAERLFVVRPLAVPTTSATASASELERFPSVAVFLDRARARDADFAIDGANARDVAEICRRLDGLPLALELAAARVGLLAPSDLPRASGSRARRARRRRARCPGSPSHASRDHRLELQPAHRGRAAGLRPDGATAGRRHRRGRRDHHRGTVGHPGLAGRQAAAHPPRRPSTMLETVREYAAEQLAGDPGADAARLRLANAAANSRARSRPVSTDASGSRCWPGSTPSSPTCSPCSRGRFRSAMTSCSCDSSAASATTGGTRVVGRTASLGSTPPSTTPRALPTMRGPRRCSTAPV